MVAGSFPSVSVAMSVMMERSSAGGGGKDFG